MKKINFEDGTLVSNAKVTIDNVEYEVTPAEYSGNTPLSADTLNLMQSNIEEQLKTTQTTDIAEAITITDCAGVNGSLDIKDGKTIQEGTPTFDTPIDIRNVGDNINFFNIDEAKIGYSAGLSGVVGENITINAQNNSAVITIKVKPNTRVYLKSFADEYNCRFYVGQSSDGTIQTGPSKGWIIKEGYIDTETNTKYLTIVIRGYSYDTMTLDLLKNFKIKIAENILPISHSEYNCGSADFQLSNEDNSQSRIVYFPFTEGQVLHKGDYLASDGIHQNRKTYVFTGEEDFDMETINGLNFFVNNTATLDFKYIDDNTCNYICNSFAAIKVSERWQDNTLYINGSKKITITSNNFTSVEELKTFLATQYANGTPVTIEYELAEEVVTPYTEEQEQAYYELQHLLMYEDYTNIECIDEIKPDIQVTYLYNNEINKSFDSRTDKLEDEVYELKKQVADLTAMVLST